MVTPTKIFLTGFEPFGGLTNNPSQIVAEALSQQRWAGAEVRHLILLVVFSRATKIMAEFYRGVWHPDIVVHLGVASSRNAISLERFAVNMMDTAMGDNAGYCPEEVPVVTDAPLAYQATIPCKRITNHLRNNSLNASLSNSAGTYVCNAVMFTSLHCLSKTDVKCGFIHLPLFETIDKNLQVKTIKTIIQWLKNQQQEFRDCHSLGNAQQD